MPGLREIVRGLETRKTVLPLIFDEIADVEGTKFSRIRAEEGLPRGEEEYRETVEHAKANFGSNYDNFIWAMAANITGVSSEDVRNRMIDSAEDAAKVSFIGEDFNFSNDLVDKIYRLAGQEVPSDRALEIVKVGEQVAQYKVVETRPFEEQLVTDTYGKTASFDYDKLRKNVDFARKLAEKKGIDVAGLEIELYKLVNRMAERSFFDGNHRAAREGIRFLGELAAYNKSEDNSPNLFREFVEKQVKTNYDRISKGIFEGTPHIGLRKLLRGTRELAAQHGLDVKPFEIGVLESTYSHVDSWKELSGYQHVKGYIRLLRHIASDNDRPDYVDKLDALKPNAA